MQSTQTGHQLRWILEALGASRKRPSKSLDSRVFVALCEANQQLISDLVMHPPARRLLTQCISENPALHTRLDAARDEMVGARHAMSTHFDLFLGPRYSELLHRIAEHRIRLTPHDRFEEAVGHPDLIRHGFAVLNSLSRHNVQMIGQGSVASALRGAPLGPSDLDLIVDWSDENLHNLDAAMRCMGMKRTYSADKIVSYRYAFAKHQPMMVIDAVAATNLGGQGADFASLIDRCDEFAVADSTLNVPPLHDLLAFAQQYEDQPGATHALFKHPRTVDALEITRSALGESGPIQSPWYARPEISFDSVLGNTRQNEHALGI